MRAGWVADLDRVKCVYPCQCCPSPEFCVRYVNPIQERRQKNGPAGAQIAEDAAAPAPPPKPKKEVKKDAAEVSQRKAAGGGVEGGSGGKPKPVSSAASGGKGGVDAGADADGAGSVLSETEKQLRALRKKLRQIEIIESKDAPTQEELEKVGKKAEIVAALARLQV